MMRDAADREQAARQRDVAARQAGRDVVAAEARRSDSPAASAGCRWDRGRIRASASRGRAPTASITKSAPAPGRRPAGLRPPDHRRSVGPVAIARTRCDQPSPSTLGSSTWVAPTFSATSRRALIGSIAMIVEAPAMRAPCTALSPSGPQPTHGHDRRRARPSPAPARRRRAEAGDRDAAADHADVGGARLGEDRHDPLLERHHQLGQPADVRVLVDGRAVAQFGHRDEIVGADGAQELTHVGAAAQAAVAGAALRRTRHADAIADLHAPHLGPHGLDDADAAVPLDDRHLVHAPRARGRRESTGPRRGRRLYAEHGGTFE